MGSWDSFKAHMFRKWTDRKGVTIVFHLCVLDMKGKKDPTQMIFMSGLIGAWTIVDWLKNLVSYLKVKFLVES